MVVVFRPCACTDWATDNLYIVYSGFLVGP